MNKSLKKIIVHLNNNNSVDFVQCIKWVDVTVAIVCIISAHLQMWNVIYTNESWKERYGWGKQLQYTCYITRQSGIHSYSFANPVVLCGSVINQKQQSTTRNEQIEMKIDIGNTRQNAINSKVYVRVFIISSYRCWCVGVSCQYEKNVSAMQQQPI